ncbi:MULTISPECIES: hypothetical protein [Listeria]|uniref:hypothetical protein n=1 Tax=Listeria TaxID=1637 RepID=UPI000B58F9FA|nr:MULTISPECIES: hypothetical protein [Listeria]
MARKKATEVNNLDLSNYEIVDYFDPETGYRPNVDLKVVNDIFDRAPMKDKPSEPLTFPNDQNIMLENGRMKTVIPIEEIKSSKREVETQ